ncbi:hypothetical protein [Desulfosoma sp.]
MDFKIDENLPVMEPKRCPFDTHQIPENSIHSLFEDGESAHGVERIVRVGAHTGANQWPSRLKQHFVQENKDRSIYAGAEAQEGGGEPFEEKIKRLVAQLREKQAEAARLDEAIWKTLKELGYGD